MVKLMKLLVKKVFFIGKLAATAYVHLVGDASLQARRVVQKDRTPVVPTGLTD